MKVDADGEIEAAPTPVAGDVDSQIAALASIGVRAHRRVSRLLPSAAWRETRGMLNRLAKPDCPLCRVWGIPHDDADRRTWRRQHIHAEVLWDAADGRRGWPDRVAALADRLGIVCTPEQARLHYLRHRPEQPAAILLPERRELYREALELTHRQRALIICLFRQRVLTRNQLLEVLYEPYSSPTVANAEIAADLATLTHRHFVYRWYPEPSWARQIEMPIGVIKHAFYFPGKASVPLLEQLSESTLAQAQYAWLGSEIGLDTLWHDVRSAGVYVALAKALRRRGWRIELPGGVSATAWLPLDGWLGMGRIGFRFADPYNPARIHEMRPDGFATLSIARTGYAEADQPSVQLPFFYEYDNNSRSESSAGMQMFGYQLLASSGAVGKRFPQLAVDGYRIPLVMVLRRNKKRILQIAGNARRRGAGLGIERGTPLYVVTQRDWDRDPLTAPLYSVWEPERETTVIEAIYRSSTALMRARMLTAEAELVVTDESRPRWANRMKEARIKEQLAHAASARERAARVGGLLTDRDEAPDEPDSIAPGC